MPEHDANIIKVNKKVIPWNPLQLWAMRFWILLLSNGYTGAANVTKGGFLKIKRGR